MGINVLSLFDGMSCGQIALERAGIVVDKYFASEIDSYAVLATRKNYPDTIHLGDVTKIISKNLPRIDLLIGGSPCQGFSFMGNQLNFNDPRSRLFFEFVRLRNETCPKYFLLENVKMRSEFENIISKELNVLPVEINSSLFSAQLRRRIYWTNIPINQIQAKNIRLNDVLEYGVADREKSLCLLASYSQKTNSDSCVKHYKNKSVGQLVLDPSQKTGYRKLTVKECERLQTVPEGYLSSNNKIPDKESYKMLGNGWTVDVISHIFNGLPEELKKRE